MFYIPVLSTGQKLAKSSQTTLSKGGGLMSRTVLQTVEVNHLDL